MARQTITGALVDVARDISALQDADLLLHTVIRRVRRLLGTDLAYVSLNDPDASETFIRSTDGVRTAAYAAIRMPLGTGVLGLAAGGIVTETPDYLPDEGKTHLPDIDRTVQAEGVHAILGAPLRSSGKVVGALVVANRTPGAFSAAQRSHLGQLATLIAAAVELVSAKAAERAARADAENATHARDEVIAEAVLQNELDAQLAQALTDGKQLPTLVELAASLTRSSISVLAPAGDELAPTVDRRDTADDETEARAPLLGPAVRGTVTVRGPDTASRGAATAASLARFASIALLYERTIDDVRHFHDDELINSLVAATADARPDVSAASVRRALGSDGAIAVAVLAPADREDTARRRLLARVRSAAGHHQTVVGMHRGRVVCVARCEAGALRDRLAPALHDLAFFGGVAGASSDAATRDAWIAAASIEAAMRSLRRTGVLADRAAAGIAGLLLDDASPAVAESFLTAHLGRLLSDPKSENLLRTALTYLDAQQRISDTARQLGIHTNTVRQRVERIDTLLGEQWRRGPRSIDTHVALRLCQLSGRLHEEAS